jgi:CheY-like chemotaxis protein
METMLQRLIGEDISLTACLASTRGSVKADAGQLEQVIVNLVVNARDAMPLGGVLTLTTCDVKLGDDYVMLHPQVKSGHYVKLAVSDTGTGMNQATKDRIFEPFFTTKEQGKGTGLGLATVYGIVTQSGGHIRVHSEIGQGTSFSIYFPSVETCQLSRKSSPHYKIAPRGNETIMLVEDEEAVRATTKLALQFLGYTVLEAESGAAAIRQCNSHPDPIHLLISDVVMPEMGGRLVAERVATIKPEIKVLFFSGYTDDAVVRHGISKSEVAFLQKPFKLEGLANKVREVLDM